MDFIKDIIWGALAWTVVRILALAIVVLLSGCGAILEVAWMTQCGPMPLSIDQCE